ncbi:molybdopterin biosynthesis MoaE protein [Pyrolobus fumarii 1A]|uniref:Molybdopterin biosynthesis MoaE protein n=1 Tax=Pyrolobus fumarii (strain DSM 11204 / 1A) TaxID=694429 RepID=G0EF74_PYRF1|nr:molybdenum cofactor biosynthesis protein MoaE [Pyrolobus fumarii]AEM38117.1 molybdopterin biosynthesis MoaE protein [Pyrolobus fumarii 1A]
MRVRLRLVAMFRDMAGVDELTLEVERDSVSVGMVVEEARRRLPGLARALQVLEEHGLKPLVVVNGSPASMDHVVSDGDEVVLLPPAAGGVVEAGLIEQELDLNEVVSRLAREASKKGSGALVVFVGFVKGVVDGNEVHELVYEAYEPLASRTLREIAEKHSKREGVTDVIVYHRVGRLKPGDTTIYILVAARDRKTAFETARSILEEVKHQAPIFKLERRADGDYWVMGDGVRVRREHGEVR